MADTLLTSGEIAFRAAVQHEIDLLHAELRRQQRVFDMMAVLVGILH